MANSLNRVQIIGNLGQDPTIRATPSGDTVANLSIATTDSYKDKSGQWQDTVEWHKVSIWGYNAENCQKYLKKGSKVMVEGKLATRSYEKDGITRYVTEIKGNSIMFLDAKPDNQQSNQYNQQAPPQNYNQTPQKQPIAGGSGQGAYHPNQNQGYNNPALPPQDESDVPF